MVTKNRKKILTSKGHFEECTGKEWEKLRESEREFIDFGNGFTYARKAVEGCTGINSITSGHDTKRDFTIKW